MKVFWSWQSDLPGKTSRHFIRRALDAAIDELKTPEDIEEPLEREIKNALHVDQDRQGITGSPDLVAEILRKIDQARIFVADVTPIHVLPEVMKGKKVVRKAKGLTNPNVAIELGYALKTVGTLQVLMVLNTHYGDRDLLPFDLAHKGGPLLYNLPPNAKKPAIEAELKNLSKQFVVALRPFIAAVKTEKAKSNFVETAPTHSIVSYYAKDEPLAAVGIKNVDQIEFSYPDYKGFSLRLIPTAQRASPFTKAELRNALQIQRLFAMWRSPSGIFDINKYGAAVVEPEHPNRSVLNASSQVFSNGELWGVNRWLLTAAANEQIIGAKALEEIYGLTLINFVKFARDGLQLGPPFTVEAAANGIKAYSLVTDFDGNHQFGPFPDDTFKLRLVLNSDSQQAISEALLKFYEAFFAETGYQRPRHYRGFPST